MLCVAIDSLRRQAMADTKDNSLPPTAEPERLKAAAEPGSDSDDNGALVNERALMRKLDAHLLPAVGLLYLLSFLDRSNGTAPWVSPGCEVYELTMPTVGNAKIEGLTEDIHISKRCPGEGIRHIDTGLANRRTAGNEYLTGLTVYFVGYVLFEVRRPHTPTQSLKTARH